MTRRWRPTLPRRSRCLLALTFTLHPVTQVRALALLHPANPGQAGATGSIGASGIVGPSGNIGPSGLCGPSGCIAFGK